MLISGAALEGCTTHSVAGHSVRDGAPQTGPSAFAPACVNGHLMILRGHSTEWKMCRSVERGSTCRSKQRGWPCIHTTGGEGCERFTHRA